MPNDGHATWNEQAYIPYQQQKTREKGVKLFRS